MGSRNYGVREMRQQIFVGNIKAVFGKLFAHLMVAGFPGG